MPNIPDLTELEFDLLSELFNLGVGKAAASLSKMVKQEVKLSVPELEFMTVAMLANQYSNDQTICSVAQYMEGPFNARSMLLFPEERSLEIVRKMLGDELPDEMISELQQEALSEIGNIVLNACIGSFAEAINEDFKVHLPQFELAKPSELLNVSGNSNDVVLFLKIDLTLSESKISGYLAFLLGSLSLLQLHKILKKMISNL